MATTTASSHQNSHVPSKWPGAFGLYKNSKAAVLVNIWTFVALWAINIGVNIVFSGLFGKNDFAQFLNTIASLVISLGMMYALLASAKGKVMDISEALRKAFDPMMLLKYIALSILLGIIMLFSFLLFVVPFFIVLPRLILAPYYLVDGKLGITESLSKAWEDSRGQSGLIYGVIGVFVLIALLAVTIIGIPFAIYFGILYMAALPITYYYLQHHKSNA